MEGRRRHRACEPAALACDDTPEWVRQLSPIARCASPYACTDTPPPGGPGQVRDLQNADRSHPSATDGDRDALRTVLGRRSAAGGQPARPAPVAAR